MSRQKTEILTSPLLDMWDEVKKIMDHASVDAFKNGYQCQLIPGCRWRHAMREMRVLLLEIIKLSSNTDKQTKAKRLATRPKGQTPGKNRKQTNI
jgi:hypothetical protein